MVQKFWYGKCGIVNPADIILLCLLQKRTLLHDWKESICTDGLFLSY